METQTATQINPSKIIQVGMGFMASKTLLTAVNMELFTLLANGGLSGKEIQTKLGLHEKSLYDFLDTIVALGFLNRSGLKNTSVYSNSEDANLFLDKNKPSYVGGILEMSNNRLYSFWSDLEEGLKTGKPQNETKHGVNPLFEGLYSNKERLREFIQAMGGVQMGNFITFSREFDFSNYNTLADIGGSGANLSIHVAKANPHMNCVSIDLPPVYPIATENIRKMGLESRVKALSGDFFKNEFPNADVITMGNILHDWGLKDKKMLIKKAYNALPKGGALVVIENIIDNDRKENAFGLLISLNMMIETPDGFDFTADDFNGWAKEIGFSSTHLLPLTGPASAIIAIK